jgi:type II secretory pathway pseudopilin PulG
MRNCNDEPQPMKKQTKHKGFMLQNDRGFSLLEVLLGISVFMIGMLGVTALNISSMKSNTFSGNLSEATLVAASKLEELMAQDFDDPASQLFDEDNDGNCHDTANHTCAPAVFVNQDADDDGIDDDLGTPGTHDDDTNFGLDDFGADADYTDQVVKNNIIYDIYWNVAENEPISIEPDVADANPRTKLINVIVEWKVKDEPRRISMSTIRQKE